MKAIVAVNNLGFIGINGGLLWKCKEDLEHFKRLTLGQSVLVGYNTFVGLPKLLNREIILDDRESFKKADWCIGGKKTYEKYCHLFTEIHVSHIDNNDIGDTVFPNLSNLNKDCRIFNYYFK